jgi:hypothetical protein
VEQYGELAFSLDFYLQAQGLDHLADAMEGSLPPRFQRMTRELCEVGGLCVGVMCEVEWAAAGLVTLKAQER